jgi:exopolyphosphatase/guanosine-5'-triphosphate,3'-diphosphate pyrophosphatase
MRVAAIDIGSNSVHMIVARIRPDLSFEVIDREKDMIRLGAGGLDGRELSGPAVATAMQTLARFRRLAESHGVDEIIAAATSAVREAENGGDVIALIRRETGIAVRVISGTEEARLIHLAAAYAVDIGAHPAIVLDIGGGSVEITLGTSARLQISRSFKIGVIRLTERFVKTDPISGRDERRLVRHIRRETGGFLKQIARRRFDRVIGTSGTILALGAAAASGSRAIASGIRNLRIQTKALHRLRKQVTSLTLDGRLKLPGLDPGRADLAVAGSVLLDTLLSGLGASEITLCDFALREGLVLDYIQRNAAHIRKVDRYPDVRRRSVIELAERCHYVTAHAQQVARLSLALFDQTRRAHGLDDRAREWLEYAALLHDVGVHIGYERHHKHSYYLIRNGGLRGFAPDEIDVIALVARYHRQATPKRSHAEFAELARDRRHAVTVLAALLRLAEGLDRSHAQAVTGLDVRAGRPGCLIRLHTTGDAELEVWAAHRHAAPLAAVVGGDVRFEVIHDSSKDTTRHAEHTRHASHLPRPALRRRGHRRIGQDHAARPAG